MSNAAVGNTIYNLKNISHMFYAVEISMFKNLQNIKIVLFIIKWAKIIFFL